MKSDGSPGERVERRFRAGTESRKRTTGKNAERPGFIKRFLKWIAKGAESYNAGGTTCPS